MIQFFSSGVILVNTSGSLAKLLIPMTEYLWLNDFYYGQQIWNTKIQPFIIFWIVERTARVSAACSKVWGVHSCGANVDRTTRKRYRLENESKPILCDVSVGVLTGVDGDDLDVNPHEVVGRAVVLDPPPACGLNHLAVVTCAGVWGKTNRPDLGCELYRLGQGQNLRT